MRNKRRLAVVGLVVLFAAGATVRDASAYSGTTTLSYSTSSGELSGYTATWKDWWDVDSGYYCASYGYDPETGAQYCASLSYWEDWVSVIGHLYTPSGSTYAAGYAKAFSYVELDLNPFTPSDAGIWTHVGD